MRKLITITATALIALPAIALAGNDGTPNPHSQAVKNCRAQRAQIGDAAFKTLYGTNHNKANAFGKCVSKQEKAVAKVNKQAQANASQSCRAEQTQLGDDAFQDKYSTNKNKHNPHGTNGFGKCVSAQAKAAAAQQNAAQNQVIINAARACKAERTQLGTAAFAAKYGTNRNKSNAYGRCVSQKAKAS